ncbi:hypothetical protein Tco_0014239 [Tanacetum coccineum]
MVLSLCPLFVGWYAVTIANDETGIPMPRDHLFRYNLASLSKGSGISPLVYYLELKRVMQDQLGHGKENAKDQNIEDALTHNPLSSILLLSSFGRLQLLEHLQMGLNKLSANHRFYWNITITEEYVWRKRQLADASGALNIVANEEIFAGLQNIGSKSGGWDQFGSNIATALICLSTGRDFNFSKLIFDGMISNLKSISKFLMKHHHHPLLYHFKTPNHLFHHFSNSSPSYHAYTEVHSFEPSYHMSPPPSHEPENQASRSSEESEQLRNLMDILREKVKKLENKLRKKRKRKETEDAEGQNQEVPSQTDQENTFATPEKVMRSGEAQDEQISPSTLEAASILI